MNRKDGRSNNVYKIKFNLLVEKYGVEKIKEIIKELPKINQKIICLYYGIDEKACSQREIVGITNIYIDKVSDIVKDGLSLIISKLENKEEDINYSREEKFWFIFSKYDKEKVLNCISRLNSRDAEMVVLYYGLNGGKTYSYKELSEKYGISLGTVYLILFNSLKIVKNMLDDPLYIYSNNDKFKSMYFNYSKEDIDYALSFLNDMNREIFCLYYGLNGNKELTMKEIGEKFGITISNVNLKLTRTNKRMKEILSVEKNTIKEVLELCDEGEVSVIERYIDKEFSKVINIAKEVSNDRKLLIKVSELYNVGVHDAQRMLNKVLKRIEYIRQNRNIFGSRKKVSNILLACDSEVAARAIISLDKRDREIFCLYYGLDGGDIVSMRDIALKYNVSLACVEHVLSKSLEQIIYLVNNPHQIEFVNSYNKFLKEFGDSSKENVENALIKFSEKNREIISMYYGLNGKKELSLIDISKKYDVDIDSISKIVEMCTQRIKDYLVDNKVSDSQKFLNVCIKKYGIENFNRVLESFQAENKKIICLYYGIYGYKEHSLEDIASILEMNVSDLCWAVDEINSKIVKKLNDIEMENVIFVSNKKFKSKLVSEENYRIRKALTYLKNDEENLLSLYYGLNGRIITNKEELAKMFLIGEKELEEKIQEIIIKINNILVKQNLLRRK